MRKARKDLYGGPYQNITGYDWIGDIPYIIDENKLADTHSNERQTEREIGFPIHPLFCDKEHAEMIRLYIEELLSS